MTEAPTPSTAPAATAPAARSASARPRPAYRHSRPVFDLPMQIHSEYARRLLRDREFRPAMHALYGIEVILHLVGEDDEAEQVETLIRERLEGLADELQREIARVQVLLADRGLDTTRPRYTHPITATVHVASPAIALYANLIQELDRLLMGLDTLWLSGLVPSKERLEVAIRWRNRIGGAGQDFIGLHRRAYAAAERRGQRAAVDEAAREVVSMPDEEAPESEVADDQA